MLGVVLLPVFVVALAVLAIRLPSVGMVFAGATLLVGLVLRSSSDSLSADTNRAVGQYFLYAGAVTLLVSVAARLHQRRRDRRDPRIPPARVTRRRAR